MQDIHSIGGGGGRFFGGGGVDRRLRPNNHQSHHHQALKCPRCDSLNTKFCYYNNYNLSQPRHFCKSCRRYWTKGGVLRNVPVGGGCRKTKRAKPKSSSSERKSNNSNSSSESSSLTASTAAVAKPPATSAAATTASPSTSASTLLNYPDSRFFNIPVQSTDPSFDPPLINQPTDGGGFAEIGSFTSMMTSTNDPSSFLGFNIGGISAPDYRLLQETNGSNVQNQSSNHQWQDQREISGGFFNQTAQMELSGMDNRPNSGVVGALDWQGGGDQGMFDLTGTVDHAYWSQTQWPDNDQSLYLP